MRILVLIHRLNDNSPYCFYVQDQVRALTAMGHFVAVIAPVGWLPGYARLRPAAARVMQATPRAAMVEGVPVHYPRHLALGNVGTRLLGGRTLYRAALPIAHRLHREQPFDLIHAHMLTMEGHAALLLGNALGIPAVVTVHGTDVLHYFPVPPATAPAPWPRNVRTAQRVDALMAVSPMLAGRVAPYRSGGIDVIPNGVDLSLLPENRANTPHRIVSGGTLKARKAMHTTLDAFLALAQDFPDATLTIFGEGPDRASLEAKIAAHGMQARVTLTGNIPHADVLALMAGSDAFVMPSYGEGFGVVYIEAMAVGCVAVGSIGEGIDGILRDGENGFLVPAAHAKALTPVLRRILSGGADIERIRERGVRTARELTWASNAALTTAVYARVLASRK